MDALLQSAGRLPIFRVILWFRVVANHCVVDTSQHDGLDEWEYWPESPDGTRPPTQIDALSLGQLNRHKPIKHGLQAAISALSVADKFSIRFKLMKRGTDTVFKIAYSLKSRTCKFGADLAASV